MAPKVGKGKAVSTEAERMTQLRKKYAIFAPTLTASDLKKRYQAMWAAKTKAHPRTRVHPGSAEGGQNKYPFFAAYFWCGLCPPFSEFFNDVMYSFGLHLLDFTPNAVTTMSVFAHLCENFAGVIPNTALFRHYFIPRVEKGECLSGGVSWIPRPGSKDTYPEGEYRGRWEEWRSEWCWIVDDDPQSFCALRQSKVVRGKDWSDLDPQDDKLEIATTRIHRLRAAGLTVEMVGADFLRRRIAPLQNRKRPAWDFKNAADIMRLRPGLNNNLTILEHDSLLHELFKYDPKHLEVFRLLRNIIPLCNNSAVGSIVTMMRDFNAHGLDPLWKEPKEEDVRQFFDTLEERAVREENLIRDTTDQELAYIASRVEEARLAAEAGEFGFTMEEAEEAQRENLAGQDELAEQGELAGEANSSAAGGPSTEEAAEEPLHEEPPVPQRKKRILHKGGEPVQRQETQQLPPRRLTRSTVAATGAAGASQTTAPATGAARSSKSPASASAKRPRASPPPRTDTGADIDFDISALDVGGEEE